ncbi:ABC transporter substrate-binding protein [Pseudofrankia saprophytica]|uniref:ABC transporter substrate-binding protein n=1 Tax=Pseudofrankia saprophytica TaxID=298655 RepID=UPI000234D8AD|nr:ABC transporter substrate-binding protein [Pseudofrankia saprophytica]
MILLRSHRARAGLAGVAALVAAVTFASCSSTTDNGTSSAPVDLGTPMDAAAASKLAIEKAGPIQFATGSTVRGVNGKVITIGGVADVKDTTGIENFPGVCDGAKARFERANREGGVNGYTFSYVGCADSGGDPTKSKDAVTEMVEDKKVFGLVPFTATVSTVGDYLNDKHVPYFGWGISNDYCGWNNRQFGFSITQSVACTGVLPGQTFYSSAGLESYLAGAGKKPVDVSAAFVGLGAAASENSVKSFAKMAVGLGMKAPYAKSPIPGPGAPPLSDYTPIARDIIASGANLVASTTAPGTIFPLVAALRSSGYTGDILIYFADPRLAPLADQLDGVYAMTPNFGSGVFPSATFKQIDADLKAVGSQADASASGTLTSYGAADLFLKAFAKINGSVTTEALAKVLNSGFDYPALGNALCGSTWPAGRLLGNDCAAIVRFDGPKKTIEPIKDLQTFGHEYLFPLT